MNNHFKALNAWSLQWAKTKWGALALFICAFADASFLPLPTPMFFMILTLLNPENAFKYVIYATLGSFFGSMAGYSIGHYAWLNADGGFTELAQFVFNHIPGFSEIIYDAIFTQFVKWDFGVLFVASFLPVPYKIFSISSGVFDINIYVFCLVTLVGQGLKFYLMALLIQKIGPEMKKIFEFKLTTALTSCLAKISGAKWRGIS